MSLTTVAWLTLELNSQKWIYSILLQAHICWLFGSSDFNTISDFSRDLMLPVQGDEKSYPFRDERIFRSCYSHSQILVAARSKAWVCGGSLVGIAGSNSSGAWSPVCCDCCMSSGRVLFDGPITRPEESYRVWWV
jgi:hypothetical protein